MTFKESLNCKTTYEAAVSIYEASLKGLTCEKIAQLTGLSAVSVSRVVRAFEGIRDNKSMGVHVPETVIGYAMRYFNRPMDGKPQVNEDQKRDFAVNALLEKILQEQKVTNRILADLLALWGGVKCE